MNEIIGIIPHKFRRRGFGVACTLLLRAGLNFLGLAVLLPVLALALDARSLDGGGQLARIYTALGFTSPRSFALTVCAAVVAVIVLKCLTNLWLARIERNYIYDLYRTLSRRLYVTYHDRGLPFVKSSNSAVLARNVNVVCLAFTAGVLKPAAAIAAEAMLLTLLHPSMQDPATIAVLLKRSITAIALDLVEDRRGMTPFADILSEIDGRAAVALASSMLADPTAGKGILLGGVTGIVACETTIIGSGIAACAAARSAAGLGATVRMFDNDVYSLRRAIRELGQQVIGSALHPHVLHNALR